MKKIKDFIYESHDDSIIFNTYHYDTKELKDIFNKIIDNIDNCIRLEIHESDTSLRVDFYDKSDKRDHWYEFINKTSTRNS